MKKNDVRIGDEYLVSRDINWMQEAWAEVEKATVIDSEPWHKDLARMYSGADPVDFTYLGESIRLSPSFVRGWSRRDFSGILCKLEKKLWDGTIETHYDIVHLRYLRAPWDKGLAKRQKHIEEQAVLAAALRHEQETSERHLKEALQFLANYGIDIPYEGGDTVTLDSRQLNLIVGTLNLRKTA